MRNLRKKFPGKAVVDIKLGFIGGSTLRCEGPLPALSIDLIAMLCGTGASLTKEQSAACGALLDLLKGEGA